MTQNKLHIRIASAILFALACVTSAVAADKISIGYLSSTGQGKFFIAKDAGIFEKNGLDVTLVEFSNSGDGIAAVRAGKLDAGAFGSLAPLIHIAQGADIRVIGGIMGGDQAVITRKENAGSVKKLSDLKGKKIATIRLGTADAIVRGGLKKEGIDWRKDVSIVELKNPPAVIEAVKNGSVYAGVTWGPHDLRAEEAGLSVVLRSKDINPGHICCRLIASLRKLEGRDDVYKRLVKSLLEAEELVQNAKWIKLDTALVNKAFYSGHVTQDTDPNVKGVEFFWDFLKDAEFIKSDKKVSEYVITDYYRNALAELRKQQPKSEFYAKAETIFKSRN
jgi:NitT/TauT family transport system substrate-binding protein